MISTHSKFLSVWSAPPGIWFSLVAILALLWNLGGAMQFVNAISATEESMKGAMMTPEQIAVISALPVWVTLLFGIGVVTSLLGSVYLYLRHKYAKLNLLLSFIAFILLSVGYKVYGVFEAMGTQQVITMSIVVVLAGVLFLLSRMIKNEDV
jgi:hypothetical protein